MIEPRTPLKPVACFDVFQPDQVKITGKLGEVQHETGCDPKQAQHRMLGSGQSVFPVHFA